MSPIPELCQPCLKHIEELGERVKTIEIQQSERQDALRVVRNCLISILGFTLIQIGTLLWFLAADHSEQKQMASQMIDHETRIRVVEKTPLTRP